MLKKILSFGVVIAMLLTLVACTKMDSSLEEFKKAARTELQEYVNRFEEDNYSEENWARLEEAVANGISTINKATVKLEIKNAIDAAKRNIYFIYDIQNELINGLGEYDKAAPEIVLAIKNAAKVEIQEYADSKVEANYTEEGWAAIQNAILKGKESVDAAINSIKLFLAVSGAKQSIWQTIELDDAIVGLGEIKGLSVEIELAIIKEVLGDGYYGQESVDNSPIERLFGIYNDCLVIDVRPYISWGTYPQQITIEDLGLVYYQGTILVWKDGKLYSFYDAFREELFEKADADIIADFHREWHPELYKK